MEAWAVCFARVLRLRAGNEGEALVAAFIEARADPPVIVPFAELALEAAIAVPLPARSRPRPSGTRRKSCASTPSLLLWHSLPGAALAAEAKLVRALEIAREQTALSWELRVATSLVRLRRRQGRAAEARELLATTYGRFTEGFGTVDLNVAKALLDDLP